MSVPNKIFIIPYRNRENQKTHFEIYMKYLLEDIPVDEYEIYFVHQCDHRPFNRGAIKNIGFVAMKNKYPNNYKDITFIFNDIDTLPYKKHLLDYNTESGTIKHYYGFEFALGGIFSITGEDFEKIDGFPNFWGWGLEDNMIQCRVLNKKLIIDRTNFYSVHSSEILQIHNDVYRLVTNRTPDLIKKLATDGLKDIQNLNYKIENNMINVTSFTVPDLPEQDQFFHQDLFKDNRLINNRLEKQQKIEKMNRFKMSNFLHK